MAKRHEVTPLEKEIILKVYHYFTREKKEGRSNGVETRMRVMEATGFSKNTVASVWKAYNENNEVVFVAVGICAAAPG
ncbi:hypothetical protein P43SY_002133 [Pythium insidiosum]|uniref:Uncharacterized protein n=1 Tax=Pythium insidiosum TaxID=114742 RepID=A0AAD5Q3G0_PYTIN|nr:hypothetical protein P43SY_002133 [Pythium insidiosum]